MAESSFAVLTFCKKGRILCAQLRWLQTVDEMDSGARQSALGEKDAQLSVFGS